MNVTLSACTLSRASATIRGEMSIAVTRFDRVAIFAESCPSPHPTSRAAWHGTGMLAQIHGWKWKLWFHGDRRSGVRPDPKLVDVLEQVARIFVDAIRARALQLVAPVTA